MPGLPRAMRRSSGGLLRATRLTVTPTPMARLGLLRQCWRCRRMVPKASRWHPRRLGSVRRSPFLWRVERFLVALAQNIFLDFAHRVTRQIVHDKNTLGHLVICDAAL